MFKDIKNIIYDKNFRITIFKNKININNYYEILVFEDNQILVKAEFLIKIKGSNLVITRLENNELLIEGEIKNIEFG